MKNKLQRMESNRQVEALNTIFCTAQVVAANVKYRHWTVFGTHFRSIHLTLDDVYKTLQSAIDRIAETIVVLDATPAPNLSAYLEGSTVAEITAGQMGGDAQTMVRQTRDELNVIISHVHAGVRNKLFDPTTENDLLNATSELRHWVLFLDGFISNWNAED